MVGTADPVTGGPGHTPPQSSQLTTKVPGGIVSYSVICRIWQVMAIAAVNSNRKVLEKNVVILVGKRLVLIESHWIRRRRP